jgi:hypothetical protein
MKTQTITNNEINLKNLPCTLFVNWYNETTYELVVAFNNKVYKSLTNKIEVVNIALNSLHENQQEFAEYLVNEVRLNNILEFKF